MKKSQDPDQELLKSNPTEEQSKSDRGKIGLIVL
ncbi:unnamed protein product [Rhodiola kirilowii]